MPRAGSLASRACALAAACAAAAVLAGCSAEPGPQSTGDAITRGPSAAAVPAERIAFGRWSPEEDRGLPPAIWTAAPDGSDARPAGDQRGWYLEWSPDRTQLLFDFLDDEGNEHIATVRPDGSDFSPLTTGSGFFGDPAYSPDGSVIIYSHSPLRESDVGFAPSLWMMNADGTSPRPVLNPDLSGIDYEPVFSPDGRHIAFTRERESSDGVVVSALHLATVDGTQARAITAFDDYVEHPRWSPDGRTIIYNIEPTNLDDARNGIWTIPAEGGDPRQLLPSDDRFHVFKPSYSPDGSRILFGCAPRQGLNEDLCVMNADGTDVRVVIETREYENHGVWY